MPKLSQKIPLVFVAMSGGVDSSVAALLLKQQGFDVVGVYMKNWTKKLPGVIYCPWEEDQRQARQAAAKIKIPFYTWDFEKDYQKIVFTDFIENYKSGKTPNPDVLCNKEIKFGLFLEKARKLGADFIATGHYVKLKQNPADRTTGFLTPAVKNQLCSRPDDSRKAGDQARRGSENFSRPNSVSLFIAKDNNKDQSYFLWTLKQNQLKYCIFPLGDLTKPEVRKLASIAGLPNAERKDSQGLCFVGKVSLKKFLKPFIKEKTGAIVLVSFGKGNKRIEKTVGFHQGAHLFTLGQRHGINVGFGEPLFVAAKDVKKNILSVAIKRDLSKFFPARIFVKNASWVNLSIKYPIKCSARYRYRQPLEKVKITRDEKGEMRVVFKKPAVGITPGQSIVFYKGRQMLGGGIIA
ncbi:MAG: tRNA-specific 2-thiouridylase MnmA [Parcubacteria group bacterium GW2011_GWC1_45_9]|nr:MAG: tRNA-specific 2-thiouridylase MnmA [Parcubacteria group bacterium GW2011_GWC1_45_9]